MFLIFERTEEWCQKYQHSCSAINLSEDGIPKQQLYRAAVLTQLNNSGKELADHVRIPASGVSVLARAGNFQDNKRARLSPLILPNRRSLKNPKQIWKLQCKLIPLYLIEGILKGTFWLNRIQFKYTKRTKCLQKTS